MTPFTRDRSNSETASSRPLAWWGKTFWLTLGAPLLAGIVSGAVVAQYQLRVAVPVVATRVSQRPDGAWEVAVANRGRIPATAVLIDVRFDAPIAANEQPNGVFSWVGRPLETDAALAGRDRVTLRCELLPPDTTYAVAFRFAPGAAPPGRPKVSVTSSGGYANEE